MLASLYDPKIQRGGTFSIGVTAEDANGQERSFVEYDSMRIDVRPAWVGKPGSISGDPLLSLSTEGADPEIVVATDLITITLSAAVTEILSFNSGKYELEMVINAREAALASGDYVPAVAAYLSVGTMTFTHDTPGAAGNEISVEFLNIDQVLQAVYDIGTKTISIAGDFGNIGTGIPTHWEIQNAVNDLAMGVTVSGGDTTATNLTAGPVYLANGANQVGTPAIDAVPIEIVDKLLYGTMYITGEVVV